MIGSKPNLVLAGKYLDEVNGFIYLASCFLPGGHILEEVSSRIHEARLVFASFRHFKRDIRFISHRSSLHSCIEIGISTPFWALSPEDMRRLSVSEYRRLPSTGRIWQGNFVIQKSSVW